MGGADFRPRGVITRQLGFWRAGGCCGLLKLADIPDTAEPNCRKSTHTSDMLYVLDHHCQRRLAERPLNISLFTFTVLPPGCCRQF